MTEVTENNITEILIPLIQRKWKIALSEAESRIKAYDLASPALDEEAAKDFEKLVRLFGKQKYKGVFAQFINMALSILGRQKVEQWVESALESKEKTWSDSIQFPERLIDKKAAQADLDAFKLIADEIKKFIHDRLKKERFQKFSQYKPKRSTEAKIVASEDREEPLAKQPLQKAAVSEKTTLQNLTPKHVKETPSYYDALINLGHVCDISEKIVGVLKPSPLFKGKQQKKLRRISNAVDNLGKNFEKEIKPLVSGLSKKDPHSIGKFLKSETMQPTIKSFLNSEKTIMAGENLLSALKEQHEYLKRNKEKQLSAVIGAVSKVLKDVLSISQSETSSETHKEIFAPQATPSSEVEMTSQLPITPSAEPVEPVFAEQFKPLVEEEPTKILEETHLEPEEDIWEGLEEFLAQEKEKRREEHSLRTPERLLPDKFYVTPAQKRQRPSSPKKAKPPTKSK